MLNHENELIGRGEKGFLSTNYRRLYLALFIEVHGQMMGS